MDPHWCFVSYHIGPVWVWEYRTQHAGVRLRMRTAAHFGGLRRLGKNASVVECGALGRKFQLLHRDTKLHAFCRALGVFSGHVVEESPLESCKTPLLHLSGAKRL